MLSALVKRIVELEGVHAPVATDVFVASAGVVGEKVLLEAR